MKVDKILKTCVLMVFSMAGFAVFSQESTTPTFASKAMGKNVCTQQTIYGSEYAFENKRIIQYTIDTAEQLVILKLKPVNANGNFNPFGTSNVLVYDLASSKVKWSKAWSGIQSALLTKKNILYRGVGTSSLLDVHTGKPKWKSKYNIWYIDDTSNIGLASDTKGNHIQGVNLTDGQTLWERPLKNNFEIGEIQRARDSTVLFRSNGLYAINQFTGAGWNYDAKTVSKYVNGADVASFVADVLLGPPYLGKNEHIVRNLSSNLLQNSGRIYLASQEKVSCITSDGKLFWEHPFANNVIKMISSSSIFIQDDNLFLVNYGFAEINFVNEKFGAPFFACFSLNSGLQKFMTPLNADLPVQSYKVNGSHIIILTANSLSEYSLSSGKLISSKKFESDKDDNPLRFASDSTLVFASDTAFATLEEVNKTSYTIFTKKKNLMIFNNEMSLTDLIDSKSIFIKWKEMNEFQFFGNESETVVLYKGELIGRLQVSTQSVLIGDMIYGVKGNSFVTVFIGDLIKQKTL